MQAQEQIFYYQGNQDDAAGIIISCGIHGDELVPVFALQQMRSYLSTCARELPFSLLLIFGNPTAIERRQRFVTTNLNRLFGLKHKPDCDEGTRAGILEQACIDFSNSCSKVLYHLDLHSTIKASLHPRFALRPANITTDAINTHALSDQRSQQKPASFFNLLGVSALVEQSQHSNTFSRFTATTLQCESFTVECGSHSNPDAGDIERLTQCLIPFVFDSQNKDTPTQPAAIAHFKVSHAIIRETDQFRFLIEENEPNFSIHPAGTAIYADTKGPYYCDTESATLFLNSAVPCGQRAGLLLTKI
ncbi:MAG: succinylglutamate desuccinylase [Ketobacter sp.]